MLKQVQQIKFSELLVQNTAELKNKNINIDKKLIDKDMNINCLGTHIVKINLHKSVVAELRVELKKES